MAHEKNTKKRTEETTGDTEIFFRKQRKEERGGRLIVKIAKYQKYKNLGWLLKFKSLHVFASVVLKANLQQ